eukprot:scaffold744_cov370-Prasinococcus_capsulatus_cf.AAC.5
MHQAVERRSAYTEYRSLQIYHSPESGSAVPEAGAPSRVRSMRTDHLTPALQQAACGIFAGLPGRTQASPQDACSAGRPALRGRTAHAASAAAIWINVGRASRLAAAMLHVAPPDPLTMSRARTSPIGPYTTHPLTASKTPELRSRTTPYPACAPAPAAGHRPAWCVHHHRWHLLALGGCTRQRQDCTGAAASLAVVGGRAWAGCGACRGKGPSGLSAGQDDSVHGAARAPPPVAVLPVWDACQEKRTARVVGLAPLRNG